MTTRSRFSFFQRLKGSLRFRWKWAQLGVFFFKSRDFSLATVRVDGRPITLQLPEAERLVLEHELSLIYLEDCYRLLEVRPRPRTIVDIGANVGFFSLVAKHHFPTATIHAYEPNPELQAALGAHLTPLGIRIYPEAVGAADGFIQLKLAGNSQHTTVEPSANGTIVQTRFAEVVARCKGSIDLLKLDCEGAEWDILATKDALASARCLRMEYHLWARPGSTVDDIRRLVEDAGLTVDFLVEIEPGGWGLLGASRSQLATTTP